MTTKTKKIQKVKLGEFQIASGKVRVSDPCYDLDTKCAGTVKNVLNGTWLAKVTKIEEDNWGNRCRELHVVHSSVKSQNLNYKRLSIDVGVDSGQAGIFDLNFYKKDYDTDYLQTGNLEYEHNSSVYRNKQTVKLAQVFLRAPDKNDPLRAYWLSAAEIAQEELDTPLDYSEAEPTRDFYEICCDKTLSNIGAGVLTHGAVSRSGYGDGSYSAYAAYNDKGKVVGLIIKF